MVYKVPLRIAVKQIRNTFDFYILICFGSLSYSGYPRQYTVLLNHRDEHGERHVPDVSQTVLGYL